MKAIVLLLALSVWNHAFASGKKKTDPRVSYYEHFVFQIEPNLEQGGKDLIYYPLTVETPDGLLPTDYGIILPDGKAYLQLQKFDLEKNRYDYLYVQVGYRNPSQEADDPIVFDLIKHIRYETEGNRVTNAWVILEEYKPLKAIELLLELDPAHRVWTTYGHAESSEGVMKFHVNGTDYESVSDILAPEQEFESVKLVIFDYSIGENLLFPVQIRIDDNFYNPWVCKDDRFEEIAAEYFKRAR